MIYARTHFAAFPACFNNPPEPGYYPTASQVAQAREANRGGYAGAVDKMLRRSPDSSAMLPYWDLTDAIVDGVEAMRDAGEMYLPKFVEEEEKEYTFRRKCTKFTNIYRDIVEGLASKPFDKEVSISEDENNEPPKAVLDFMEDVDGSGGNLTAFASATFFNGINSAIDWIYVDFSKADPSIRTVADAKKAGLRPYWSHVLGRNVLECRSEVINGKETLTYMRIFEPGQPDHVRVFERLPTGVVSWTLYVKTDNPAPDSDTRFVIEEQGIISIGVIPLVWFYTGRRDGRSWRFFPAMRDAADLQVELYQAESGLKYAKILTAYPMLAANGIKPQMEADGKTPKKLAIGPSRVLYSAPDGNGNAGSWAYVEPDAASLKFLAEDIKETIQQMRELGRQPLTAQSGNITVITAAAASNKAKSAVAAWGLSLKNALENALVITCAWMNVLPPEYDPTVEVYVDFDEFLEGKDLESLDADRDRGDISRETLWEEKRRRGVYGEEFTAEREEERLLKEVPSDTGDDIDDPPEPNKPKPKVKP